MAKKVSLEESFEQLETIIEQMKTGDMKILLKNTKRE